MNDIVKVEANESAIDSKEIKKHPAIIHCSNTLSLLQRKISNALLFHAYPGLLKREEHEVSIGYLSHLICYCGRNYEKIKEALRGLVTLLIEWNLADRSSGKEDWTASTMLASVRIKGGKVQYAYSPRMRDLLYSPFMYARINLVIQSKFRSSYGLALYENCVRYKGLDSTKWFEMDVFRKLMGVAEGHYMIFRDFKRRVLDKAIEEVNLLSDLVIEPELTRQGSKVTGIRFLLKAKGKKKRFVPTENSYAAAGSLSEQEATLLQRLKADYGFADKEAKQLLQKHTAATVEEKLIQIESSHSFLAGKIKNLSGYLIDALANNYQVLKSSQLVIDKKQRERNSSEEEARAEAKRTEMRQQQYSKYLNLEVEKVRNNLDSKLHANICAAFEKELADNKNHFILERYRKSGLNNKIVATVFNQFFIKHKPDFFKNILPFEDFLAQS
jgi:plasmid replication initiation protein